jgi:flavin reductase (DIM6/NTAB) family NADH-FMN oxidoreductase RutF
MSHQVEDTGIPKPFDIREFRNALGGFVTGVTVVTTIVDGRPIGFTANSFTSVSLDPPLILVCIGKSSSNYANFTQVDKFCVNVLAGNQRDVSRQFSAKGVDRFAGIAWSSGELDSPRIPGVGSWFDCTLHDRIDAGDHEILIGRVHEFGDEIGSPLAFCRGNYVLFELDRQILSLPNQRGRFGAILETRQGIIFVPGKSPGSLALPTASRLGTREASDGLFQVLSSLGLAFELEFLFSVWEDKEERLNVFFRGNATGSPESERAVAVPLNALPLQELSLDDQKLLIRYREESQNLRFSLYSGTHVSGNFWGAPHSRR